MPLNPKAKKFLKIAALVVGVVGIAIQFVPVEGIGDNPEERFAIDAPPEVEAILRESCYDCHSNETRWPFYMRIAPGSWLIARDVRKGRTRFNVSEWGDYDDEDKAVDKESAWDEIDEGEMPPWFYLPLHPGAMLNDEKKATLKAWLMADADRDWDAESEAEAAPESDEGDDAETAGTDQAAEPPATP